RALRAAFTAGCDRFQFRLCHFSMQQDHLHLLCEADDARCLARGMKGLEVRLARRLNKLSARRGNVFLGRYHARQLHTPTEVRAPLVYVYGNARKHWPPPPPPPPRDWVDPYSSAPWFTGWVHPPRVPWARPHGPPLVAAAACWLLTAGWRRAGLLKT